jgi:hypothetical protein
MSNWDKCLEKALEIRKENELRKKETAKRDKEIKDRLTEVRIRVSRFLRDFDNKPLPGSRNIRIDENLNTLRVLEIPSNKVILAVVVSNDIKTNTTLISMDKKDFLSVELFEEEFCNKIVELLV